MDSPAWQPQKISRDDLRAPVTAELRRLPADMRDGILARRRELVHRIAPWGPGERHRLRVFVLRGVFALPVIAWITTPVGLTAFPWLALLGAAYGALLALRRPAPLEAACWAMLTGVLVILLGTERLHPWAWVSSWLLITAAAGLVNIRLGLTRLDPEWTPGSGRVRQGNGRLASRESRVASHEGPGPVDALP